MNVKINMKINCAIHDDEFWARYTPPIDDVKTELRNRRPCQECFKKSNDAGVCVSCFWYGVMNKDNFKKRP